MLLFAAAVLQAQQSSGPGASAATGMQTGNSSQAAGQISAPPQTGDPQYQGSVPQGHATSTVIPLSFGEAITKGLKTNLGLLTSEESSSEIRAQRMRALSALLPKVTGQVNVTEQQLNLQAMGFLFHFPGVSTPSIVGPYNYQLAAANVNAALFDYSALSNYRASKEEARASLLSVKNARDLVVQAVGNAYLQIIADASRITAAQAEIDADRAVYTNAVRRHDAGTAIAIDVLRSEVELKQRQQQLVAVSNQFEKDKLTLGRIIGLPVGQDFSVSDPSPSVPLAAISLPRRVGQSLRTPARLPGGQSARVGGPVHTARGESRTLSDAVCERILRRGGFAIADKLTWRLQCHGQLAIQHFRCRKD